MILDTLPKKSALAVLIAFSSVVWLTLWHEFGYNTRMSFPSNSSWQRDTMIILVPVLLAVWISVALAQWLIDHFQERMSPTMQYMLTASILGGLTTLSIILMEASRGFRTGIGNGVAIQLSICRKIPPATNLLLRTLLGIFPTSQALRYHVFLQDGIYLALINLGMTIFLMLILEGFVRVLNHPRMHETR